MPSAPRSFFATTPKGMEPLLAKELDGVGATAIKEARAGVGFEGTLETAYRACLWSRTASRVLLPLATLPAAGPDALYGAIQTLRWAEHLGPANTLAVDFAASDSQITHTHFGALKVKDAIVDQLRTPSGERPSVDTERPDVRVNVYLRKDVATVSLDLSGESLHRRGYREAGQAPLKENLAAAILLLAEWPRVAAEGGPLMDPMCGSGTLLIEAALMAADTAPGLLRERFGFSGWRQHERGVWERVLAEARERDRRGKAKLPPIVGYDLDSRAVRLALANVERAGLRGHVHVERRELSECDPVGDKPGVFVVNPPYGERLGEVESLKPLYGRIGDTLKQRFKGWTGYVFTGNLELSKSVGLRAARRHVLFNGAIECRLLQIPIDPESADAKPRERSAGAQMFANRLAKDLKHLSKWAKREGVTCYRVYDADMPEYAVAVDLYEKWVHVQEYERPETVDAAKAEARLHDALSVIPEVLGVRRSDVFLKVRRRQKGGGQYEKLGGSRDFREVHEGGLRFLVNFTDYLDTGLFLDHRPTRKLVGELARGKRFLNLFAYTGTASVYAAKGGAAATTTVDLSNTYLDWARRNLELNGVRTGGRHELVRADVLKWIDTAHGKWDLIFLDPPTFSKSKSMQTTFDVQRDYAELLRKVAGLLTPGGVLIFSNNFRRFKMDPAALSGLAVEDLTRATIPPDFVGNPRVHNTWKIVHA